MNWSYFCFVALICGISSASDPPPIELWWPHRLIPPRSLLRQLPVNQTVKFELIPFHRLIIPVRCFIRKHARDSCGFLRDSWVDWELPKYPALAAMNFYFRNVATIQLFILLHFPLFRVCECVTRCVSVCQTISSSVFSWWPSISIIELIEWLDSLCSIVPFIRQRIHQMNCLISQVMSHSSSPPAGIATPSIGILIHFQSDRQLVFVP